MTDRPRDEDDRLALIQGLGTSEDYENVVPLETREKKPNLLDPWITTGTDVLNIQPPEPLVTDWIDKETVSAFYGPPKKGKTFAAIDLAMCVASGTWWHGHQVTQRPVLYIAGEGIRYYPDRLRAWCEINQVRESALENTHFVKKAVNLLDEAQVLDLVDQIQKLDVGMVVVDTLARCMAGGDENSSQDMGRAVAALDQLKFANECAVVVVHHTGKDKSRGLRGSSALLGAIDSAVQVDGEGGTVRLVAEDQRGRPEGDTIRLKLKQAGNGAALVDVNRDGDFEALDETKVMKTLKALEQIHTEHGVTRGQWEAIAMDQCGISGTTFDRYVKRLADWKLVHQARSRGPWYLGQKPMDDE